MKKFIKIFFICLSYYTFAQNKKANIIFVVDGEIVKYTYGKINTGINKKINCIIEPGNFQIDEADYKYLLKNNDPISFQFTYLKECKNSEYKTYVIEDFKLNWLNPDWRYVIINIYNTDNQKYKKYYNPLPGKNYTYEYDSPGGSMRRVQKKLNKEQKQCQ